MKELSIEEKAKAYEEKLDVARHIYVDPSVKDEDKYYIEVIFPELKESEDERVRKELIQCFSDLEDQENEWYGSLTPKKIIAWLEKQGEQKPVKCNEEWYDFVRWFVKERTDNYTLIPSDTDIHTWGDIILDHAKKELEKQGKQKSVVNTITPEESLGIDSDTYNKIVDECIYGEQKPTAWNEQDEKLIKNLISTLSNLYARNLIEKETKEKYTNLLKSLKNRVQSQPKQCWSETDEKNIDFFVSAAEECYPDSPILLELIPWLKSLKDIVQLQHEWKQENTGDLTDFENAMMHIGGSFFGQHAGLDPNDTNAIKEQANVLLELVPKYEWNEEDEKMLGYALDMIEWYSGKNEDKSRLVSNWLKSLRPQSQWKPSDEQMHYLSWIANVKLGDSVVEQDVSKHLNELLKELKKLREE